MTSEVSCFCLAACPSLPWTPKDCSRPVERRATAAAAGGGFRPSTAPIVRVGGKLLHDAGGGSASPSSARRCQQGGLQKVIVGAASRKVQVEAAEQEEAVDDVRNRAVKDLRIGGVFRGKVSVVESYGAFVDIGAHVNGFVHISRLIMSSSSSSSNRSSCVKLMRVEDIVQVGQDVMVQIVDLDPCAQFISLLLLRLPVPPPPDEDEAGDLEMMMSSSSLRPLALSEQEILYRAASRRANKAAARYCSQEEEAWSSSCRRRVMSSQRETRQRVKARTRAVVAERQAFQLQQVRCRGARTTAGHSNSGR